MRAIDLIVATNNVMSLPKNRRVAETLAATPEAHIELVQEIDPASFKAELEDVPGKTLVPVKAGDTYNTAILYDADTLTLEGHRYGLQYRGVRRISKTRHYAVARFYVPALRRDVVAISWHAVTRGNDPVRVLRRRQAVLRIRREINRYRNAGIPVIVGGDTNQRGPVFTSADVTARHGIDHIYAFNAGGLRWSKVRTRAVTTASDHDAYIVTLRATTAR